MLEVNDLVFVLDVHDLLLFNDFWFFVFEEVFQLFDPLVPLVLVLLELNHLKRLLVFVLFVLLKGRYQAENIRSSAAAGSAGLSASC